MVLLTTISKVSNKIVSNVLHNYMSTKAGKSITTKNIRNVPQSIKRIVAYRYKYKCANPTCQIMLPPTWECDHIIPLWKIMKEPSLVKGDPNHVDNLQPLCPNCHRIKTMREELERNASDDDDNDDGTVKTEYETLLEFQTPTMQQYHGLNSTLGKTHCTCPKCLTRYSPYFPNHTCKKSELFTQFAFTDCNEDVQNLQQFSWSNENNLSRSKEC